MAFSSIYNPFVHLACRLGSAPTYVSFTHKVWWVWTTERVFEHNLCLRCQKELKDVDYYHRTRRDLGYVSDPLTLASDSDSSIFQIPCSPPHSEIHTIALEKCFEDSLSTWFPLAPRRRWRRNEVASVRRRLMDQISQPFVEYTHFEQWEPPTKDKVIQVNLGTEEHLKPILISENFSPLEKEDMIQLIHEYIDIFAWTYENMPGRTLKWRCTD